MAAARKTPASHPILYVDDEPENRLVFRTMFQDEFEIIEAASGTEALEVLSRQAVAVLLTDHRMPQMTGIELCEQVRDSHPRTRRMLITAYSDHQTAIEAINRGGVHAYVSKPWDPLSLRRTLASAVRELVLEEAVTALRREIEEKDRLLNLARMRDRLLHDVAGVTTRLALSTQSLRRVFTQLRGHFPPDFATRGERDLSVLERAVDHLRKLQTQRYTVAGDELRVERVPLADLFQTLESLVETAEGPGRLRVEAGADLSVVADRLSVTRVLLNLVKNGREAMEETNAVGDIIIRARVEDEDVVVDVSDAGPGVPQLVRARIFDEHFSTRRSRGGTGVGLAASKALAEANHGSLSLPDPQPERGALFRLVLPRFQEDSAEVRPLTQPAGEHVPGAR